MSLRMSAKTIMIQARALTRRHLIVLTRRPVWTFLKFILIPALCSLYLAYNDCSYKWNLAPATTSILFGTILQAYTFTMMMSHDESTGFRSLMLTMGLRRGAYYLSYVFAIMICILPILIGMGQLIAIQDSFISKYSLKSEFLVLILFTLFTLHLTVIMQAIVTLLKTPKYVAICALPFVLLCEFANILLLEDDDKNNGQDNKDLITAHPIFILVRSIFPYEPLRLALQQKTCGKEGVKNQNMSSYEWKLLLAGYQLLWTIVLFTFTLWLNGDLGLKKLCHCFRSNRSRNADVSSTTGRASRFFETRSENPEVGIRLRDLSKTFGSANRYAVNNVSLDIYKDETTLLLGHNGAGKTTLMSMILDRLKPDSGHVRLVNTTRSVGYCPQDSILDENLTVLQHLQLFNDIKDPLDPDRDANIKALLDDVELTAYAQKLPYQLSGMRRKLSAALAFVGNSKVMLLDEPSSGLDPESRKSLWNTIKRHRLGRAVLLSTQHMEEAEYLGDRIAIMSDGRIVSCGSSLFLNQLFGSGYKLKIECLASDQQRVIDFVRQYDNRAEQVDQVTISTDSDGRSYASFVVKIVADQPEDTTGDTDSELRLINLLQALEDDTTGDSGVASFSLKSPSIEDVMLNSGQYFRSPSEEKSEQLAVTDQHLAALATAPDVPGGPSNWRGHLSSLISKNWHVLTSNMLSTILYRFIAPLGLYILLLHPYFARIVSPLMFAHFIYPPVIERESKFKAMLLTSNTSIVLYWLSYLIIDMVTIIVPMIMITWEPVSWSLEGEAYMRAWAFVLYGAATAVFSYFLSNIVTGSHSAVGKIYLLQLVSSPFTIVYLFQDIDSEPLNYVARLFIAFMPVDAYAEACFSRQTCLVWNTRPRDVCRWPHQSYGLGALIFQIIFYASLLYWVETRRIDSAYYLRQLGHLFTKLRGPQSPPSALDADVVEESNTASVAIERDSNPTIGMIASDLNKSYVSNVKVVDRLSFTVNRGECFGLIGPNGSGKTSTFSMLASESKPDSGRLWAQGCEPDRDLAAYRRKINYDPQANPLIFLTVHDALYLMARLRDVEKDNIETLIKLIVRVLDLEDSEHIMATQLSGGTRRKLNLAMTLIGNSGLLLLDTPTIGVDPVSRHNIWLLLRHLLKHDMAIVVSSHAMEECEALCDRISMIANGRLRCIGTFHHLRAKFAGGYTIKVVFSDDPRHPSAAGGAHTRAKVETLRRHLESRIGLGASLADTNVNGAIFDVHDKGVKRSTLFEGMRSFKSEQPGTRFTINDKSLGDVFVKLAREEEPAQAYPKVSIDHEDIQLLGNSV